MAGSTEHWRDVCSNEAWKKIRTRKPTVDYVAHQGRDLLDCIGSAITEYHAIPKTEAQRLEERREGLLKIYALADRYLKAVREHGKEPALKSMRKGSSPPHKARAMGPGSYDLDPNLDPWIHSLAGRALEKRAYLGHLLERCCKDGPFQSVNKFQTFFAQRMAKTPPAELLRLTSGTKLEQLDPLHRDFELVVDPAGQVSDPKTRMSEALIEWISSASPLPFFLFLEGHPVCTRTHYLDDDFKIVHRVSYERNAQVRQVWIRGDQLVARGVFDTGVPMPLTTTAAGTKAGEAFVWLANGELLIHSHVSGQFHHSSFNGGHKVRCAGTLSATNGILGRIDNNSGHYQPSDRHYLTLLQIFQGAGVTDNQTKAGTHGIHGMLMPFGGFATLQVTQYNQKAARQNVRPFDVPMSVLNNLRYFG
jgi:hypothetical protein